MENLEATKLARKVLREAGAGFTMYTNKYKTMRTVKAYGGGSAKEKQKIKDAMAKAFGDSVPEIEFSTSKPYPWNRSYKQPVIIVRFPFAAGEIEAINEEAAIKKAQAARRRVENRIAICEDIIEQLKADLRAEKAELKALKKDLETMG